MLMASLVARLSCCMLISLLIACCLPETLATACAGPREGALLLTGSRSHPMVLVQGSLDGGADVNTIDGLGPTE